MRRHPAQRAAVAHIAAHRAARGGTRAEVRRLAELAWGDGALMSETDAADASWPVAALALLTVDELERSLELCAAATADAAARGSAAGLAIAEHVRAWARYERGELTAAAEAARAAIDTPPLDGAGYLAGAYVVIAHCHLHRGELTEAESALAVTGHPELSPSSQRPSLLLARAQLRLAQRRHEEAIADAHAAGTLWAEYYGAPGPAALTWRSTAALAQRAPSAASDRAAELAQAELALAASGGRPGL